MIYHQLCSSFDCFRRCIDLKIQRSKLEIAMARACMNADDLRKAAEMPRPTLNNAISGRGVSPKTAGRIAHALGIDVMELVEVRDSD